MKLNIDKLYIKNFRSFYVDDDESYHIIDLNKRGPILICGPNGSGKTSIVEAIIWCLFGRLSDVRNAGDKIVNWSARKNCSVKIITTDGYEIVRTRLCNGKSDLLILKDGIVVEGNDATNTSAQLTLNKLFGLNFNSFISSVFFGQSSGSFLSFSDSRKKSVVEDLFGLSKLNYYARVAKDKINNCESIYQSFKSKISDTELLITSVRNDINKYKALSNEFEKNRKRIIVEQENEINKLTDNRPQPIDVDKLKIIWEKIENDCNELSKKRKLKDELNSKCNNIDYEILQLQKDKNQCINVIDKLKSEVKSINDICESWRGKRGKVCPTCEQFIPNDFVDVKIKKIKESMSERINNIKSMMVETKNKITAIDNQIMKLDEMKKSIKLDINKLESDINNLERLIKSKQNDTMTISEAIKHNELIHNIDREINKCRKIIHEAKINQNNYDKLINDSNIKLSSLSDTIKELSDKCTKIANTASHYTFIYRAHSDKKNLRSFLLSGLVPILNSRLSYYFGEFGMDVDLEFNQTLQIKSNKWPYEMYSGGEKKRIDLAMMCALYDTFISMYGQKTNILVLDEIDKEFDKDGVDEYVKLIIDNLSNRIDTILVISHKDEISYAFPSQIKVKKENGVSILE